MDTVDLFLMRRTSDLGVREDEAEWIVRCIGLSCGDDARGFECENAASPCRMGCRGNACRMQRVRCAFAGRCAGAFCIF